MRSHWLFTRFIATNNLTGLSCLIRSFSSVSTSKSTNWTWMLTFSLTSSGKATVDNFVTLSLNSPVVSSLAYVNFMRSLMVTISVPSFAYFFISRFSISAHAVCFARWLPVNSETGRCSAAEVPFLRLTARIWAVSFLLSLSSSSVHPGLLDTIAPWLLSTCL